MELTLTYQPDHHDTPAAVFLRGSDTRWWLEHFRVWGLLPEDVTLLPLSAADGTSLAGLFVIFKEDKTPSVSLLPEPFVLTGKKMFIPHGATLIPAMTVAELNTLCIWKYQLLHPSLGFFGLEEEDVLQAESLVLMPGPVEEDWSNFIQDISQLPMLTSIRVEMPEEDAFMQEVKDVGDKALGDMPAPKGQPKTLLGKIWRFILYWLLRLVKGVLSFFVVTGPVTSGFMGRLMERINTKLSTMGSWFESDEDRLLRLFRENPELALQFAPPLDPNARPGGGGASGGNWMQRNTRFNSGLLDWAGSGGGAWVIADNSYAELQNHYRKAAAEAEKQGDWSRAAYIYAHLLKEYHAAAKALRQGKFYADAANIYLKQLDNLHKAAECYEEGAMYPEAIALYLKMELYEKAGDLHILNGDTEAAAECFEKKVAYDLKYDNYLNAAATIHGKLQDTPRARRCLLDGWYSGKSTEDCLQQYIQLGEEPKASTIRLVYDEMITVERRAAFLNVMNKLKDEYPEVKDTVRDLAYRLIGDSVRDGEKDLLPMLANLVPGDPFLRTDVAMFKNNMPAKPVKPKGKIKELKLREDVDWVYATNWRQQIIVIGRQAKQLVVGRCNWEGAVNYYNTGIPYPDNYDHVFTGNDFNSTLLIYSAAREEYTYELPQQVEYGDALRLRINPEEFHSKSIYRLCSFNKIYYTLESGEEGDCIFRYEAGINVSMVCKVVGELPITYQHSELFHWQGVFAYTGEECLVIIGKDGKVNNISREGYDICSQSDNWLVGSGHNGDVWCFNLLDPSGELQILTSVDSLHDIRFLTHDVFAICGTGSCCIFQLRDNKFEQVLAFELPYSNDTFIVPSGARGRYALLQDKGRLTFHDLPEEVI